MRPTVEIAPVPTALMLTALLTMNLQCSTEAVRIDNTVHYNQTTSAVDFTASESDVSWTADLTALTGQEFFDPAHVNKILPSQIRDRILSFKRSGNTYSDGAEAISETACKATIAFLERAISDLPNMELPKSVSPSVQGAIALHWVSGDHQLLVQISSATGRIYYQCDTPEGFTYGTDTKENLLQKLSTMFG